MPLHSDSIDYEKDFYNSELIANYLRKNPSFFKENLSLLEELLSNNFLETLTSFHEKKAKHLSDDYEKLKKEFNLLVKNAKKNQQDYDSLISILRKIFENGESTKNIEKVHLFLNNFSSSFAIDKLKIIFFTNHTNAKRFDKLRPYFKQQSYSSFWQEESKNLFDQNKISFAPIDIVLSKSIFFVDYCRSGAIIPLFICKKNKRKNSIITKSIKGVLVMGSKDEKRFLPDTNSHLDFLNQVQHLLNRLLSE